MIPARVSARVKQRPDSPNGVRSLGILGGMGPLATAWFYERLVRRTSARRDQDHVTVYVSADPSIPDRTRYIEGAGPDPVPALVGEARKLVSLGVDMIVMPCNSAHVFHAELQSAVPVPILDWVEATVDEVARQGLDKVGILATRGTLGSALYQRALESVGVKPVTPTAAQLASIMDLIYGPEGVKTLGKATETSIELLADISWQIEAEGAQRILLACTELPIIINDSGWRGPDSFIDPGEIAITRCLEFLSPTEPRIVR